MTVDAVGSPLEDGLTDQAWSRRLLDDALTLKRRMPPRLEPLHEQVVGRARAAGAQALILSGSTARAARTPISDLDYHLVGPNIPVDDLSAELDLHVVSASELEAKIVSGDDFVQWSLRLGLIVFDDGLVRRAWTLMAQHRPWPDVERKIRHAAKSVELARKFVSTGDEEGALVQVRTALSLAARARLLQAGVFPLSRAELSAQLAGVGASEAGDALSRSIDGSLSMTALEEAVACAATLLAQARNGG